MDFNPIDEDIDVYAFINKDIMFVNSEHFGVNPPPQTGVVHPTNIEGLSRGGNRHENLERERERKEREE